MPALSSRDANITDDAADPSAGGQHACALAPDLIELVEKRVVVFDLAKLALILFVFL